MVKPPQQPPLMFPGQVMFPQPQHLPAGAAQRACHQTVPRPVPRDFVPPKRRVGPRHPAVPGTPMPETAVHKHRQPPGAKEKIRTPEHPQIPPPARYAVDAEEPRQHQLRVPVPPAPDPAHDVRPFFWREDVCHNNARRGTPASAANIQLSTRCQQQFYSAPLPGMTFVAGQRNSWKLDAGRNLLD